MKCIDTDGNGKIELNEFLVAFQDEIGYGHGKNSFSASSIFLGTADPYLCENL